MLDNVSLVLKKHKKEQLERKMLLGEKWRPQKGFENLVFTGAFGRCITDSAIYQDMLKIERNIRAAGHEFEHVKPHTLRHPYVKATTKIFVSYIEKGALFYR